MSKLSINILLAAPRGFCAGVDRAIQIVELALKRFGAPIYVRHEIVHNQFVVEQLQSKGAIFVEELDDIPNDSIVIFSAHGVSKSVVNEAARRKLKYIDATCPLVSKVHRAAERHFKSGRKILMIGHQGHPETTGTMGQLPPGSMSLIQTVADAKKIVAPPDQEMTYVTQTTLSVDETEDIVSALRSRFSNLIEPHKEDICYATTNRQTAIKTIAPKCDTILVLGASNSSNSQRLVEVAKKWGCKNSILVKDCHQINWETIKNGETIGISAGASAPELLIENMIDEFNHRFEVTFQTVEVAKEDLEFKLPSELRLNE